MSAMVTKAPARMKRRAAASPMPRAAPVTITALPESQFTTPPPPPDSAPGRAYPSRAGTGKPMRAAPSPMGHPLRIDSGETHGRG